MTGDLYYIEKNKRATWIGEVEQLGFTVENLSDQLTEAERKTFVFLGKLKNGKNERVVELQKWDSGYVLAVRYADKDDIEFLKKTLGSRFSAPPDLKKKSRP